MINTNQFNIMIEELTKHLFAPTNTLIKLKKAGLKTSYKPPYQPWKSLELVGFTRLPQKYWNEKATDYGSK